MTIDLGTADSPPGSWVQQGYEAMLFGLDGVITRTATLPSAAWKRLFDEFLAAWATREGHSFVPFDIDGDYRVHVDGKPRHDGVASFLASRGISLARETPDDPPDRLTCCGLGNRKNGYLAQERSGLW